MIFDYSQDHIQDCLLFKVKLNTKTRFWGVLQQNTTSKRNVYEYELYLPEYDES